MNEKNIYLCGFMGCGKTSVGKKLAILLEREFVDLDILISERYGEISDIFSQKGEEYFRKIESEVLDEVSRREGIVVSCGGGTPTVSDNVDVMRASGKTVLIDTPFSECARRVLARSDGKRPLAAGGEESLRTIYNKRADIYARSADITLRPDNTPQGTAARIVRIMYPDSAASSQETDFDRSVCVPSAVMYKTPNRDAEMADELLFGTNMRIIGAGEFPLCETEYGYRGYVRASDMTRRALPYFRKKPATVYTEWCDLLRTPEYKYPSVMTLPRGASVVIPTSGNEKDERFTRVLVGGGILYARKSSFTDRHAELPFGERAAKYAAEYIGTPYRWGGRTPSGIDCSGLVFTVHMLCGKVIFRDSSFDERYVYKIEKSELRPGDIIYMKGHVAMYVGEGNAIHASGSSGLVEKKRLDDFDSSSIVCFARAK